MDTKRCVLAVCVLVTLFTLTTSSAAAREHDGAPDAAVRPGPAAHDQCPHSSSAPSYMTVLLALLSANPRAVSPAFLDELLGLLAAEPAFLTAMPATNAVAFLASLAKNPTALNAADPSVVRSFVKTVRAAAPHLLANVPAAERRRLTLIGVRRPVAPASCTVAVPILAPAAAPTAARPPPPTTPALPDQSTVQQPVVRPSPPPDTVRDPVARQPENAFETPVAAPVPDRPIEFFTNDGPTKAPPAADGRRKPEALFYPATVPAPRSTVAPLFQPHRSHDTAARRRN